MNAKKALFILLIFGVIVFIFVLYPVSFKIPPKTNILRNELTGNEFTQWQTFKSETLKYELKYPKDWGFAKQGDGFIDFGPGFPQPAGGALALDMNCLYGSETQIYGESVTADNQYTTYGDNQFIERKIFVLNEGEQRLAFHNFTIKLPDWYSLNYCKTASFVIREDVDQKILNGILSTFRIIL